jgi:PKD repeat protein
MLAIILSRLIDGRIKFNKQEYGSVLLKTLLTLVLLLSTLSLSLNVAALVVNRGPYLQTETATSIILRWRTDIATDSVVRYGTSPTQLNSTVTAAGVQTEHTVALSGLTADTRYYYSVGNTAGALEGGSVDYTFATAPVAGTAKPTRLWVIGDSGTGNDNARAVRDAYKTFTGSTPTDLWLMLGDNAYNTGTDSQYQNAVFDTYPELLQQVVVWPVLGNHDGASADSATESGPYYDIFNLPRAGEAGGLASGTEAYYSFDYGNIHFIALDSFETDRSVSGAMLTWLQNDLVANDKLWVIAFWHHPPYTKGSHNSDTETQLIDMRQNALPILESYGVDLVLTGHSHAYERSMLIDGHYGLSTSITNAMILNSGSGRADTTDGAYSKTTGIAVANEGAVYAVAGSSGKISGGALNHPAMYVSLNLLGSMVIDVNGNQMDSVFLDSNGLVQDYFTLIKGADISPPSLTSVTSDNPNSVLVEFSETVEQSSAETLSNYSIDQSIVITNAIIQPDGRSVVLFTSTLIADNPYTLTVNQVTDVALNPITANSQEQFSFLNLQSLSFQKGVWPGASYQGVIDTYLSENATTTNFGTTIDLQADGDDPVGSGRDLSISLRWDLNDVPLGAVVQSASIDLNVTNPSPNSYPLYQLLTDWFETEATWDQAQTGQPWSVVGAQGASDRGSTVLGNLSANSTGTHTIDLNADGLNTIQSWLNGTASNYGFIIASSSNSDGVDLSSSNTATAALRPKLDLIYTVPGVSNDTEAPTIPANLIETAATATSTTLAWDASTDNVGVAGYKVYRDALLIANLSATTYVDNGLQPGTTYLYSISAYDAAGNESTQSATLSVTTPNSGSIDARIIQSTDDAEQRSDGSMYLNSTDLELTSDGSLVQTVGMRFVNIQIPPGATILNAYIQYEVDETNSGATALSIQGESTADAASFSSTVNNITSRPHTNVSVAWNPVPWTVVNAQTIDQRTPDLSTIIGEIVSRSDWQIGNDVAIIVSGTGERTAESYNGEPAAAPLLHIDYTLAPAVNQAPVVSAGGDLSIQLPATAAVSTATVTDDGLLNPTLALNWSVLNSPPGSTVIFNSPDVLNPVVTVDLPGFYSLQLSADDGEFLSNDDMGLTVSAATNQLPTAVFSSTPQQGDAPLSVSFDASASSDSDGTIVSYTWDFGDGQTATGVSQNHVYSLPGSYLVQLTVTDNLGATAQSTVTITVNAVQSGLVSEHDVITGVSNQQWSTVNLSNNYNSMFVIATPVYESNTAPLVTRIRNAVGNSFEIQVQLANASATSVAGINIHYLVVEEGVYNVADHGVNLEAVKYISSVTDSDSSWVGESRSYSNNYINPVVLGQVMSENDVRFSVFWARGSRRSRAPTASVLFAGKHVAEDAATDRADETIGYLVIEAGQGNLSGSAYHAGLGADSIRGVGNNPPYTYSVSGLSSATTALLSSAAMDGVNGGWPMLYGINPVSSTMLSLAIDEDQFKDTERKHTTEQAAFIVLQ